METGNGERATALFWGRSCRQQTPLEPVEAERNEDYQMVHRLFEQKKPGWEATWLGAAQTSAVHPEECPVTHSDTTHCASRHLGCLGWNGRNFHSYHLRKSQRLLPPCLSQAPLSLRVRPLPQLDPTAKSVVPREPEKGTQRFR